MALFEWEEKFSVGINSMDSHHQKLFAIINKLHEAAAAGQATDIIGSFIKELIDYTKYHFSEEEKLLESINYRGLAAQKQAHITFIAKMEEYQEETAKGLGVFVVTKVSSTATDWLKNHILTMDKQYEAELKAKGL